MSSTLEKAVNDLSLLLVMTDANDPGGLEAADSLCNSIADACAGDASKANIFAAAQFASSQRTVITGEEYLKLVSDFVSAAMAFLNGNTSVTFPTSKGSQSSERDLGPQFDAEFLGEFISKHKLLLEEQEGSILEYRMKMASCSDSEKAEFRSQLKAYLHNLKGDAGSIGLSGIEKVTHFIEDALIEHGTDRVIDQLLSFKEWCTSCIIAYSKELPPPELSAEYLPKLKKSLEAQLPGASTESATASAPQESKPQPTTTAALPTYTISSENELLAEFIAEAEDHLGNVESLLLDSAGSFTPDNIGTMFRAVHSLKGASSYFGLVEINESSHILENLMDEVRDGKREMGQELVDFMFTYIDLEKKLLKAARAAAGADKTMKRSQEVSDFVAKLKEFSKRAPGQTAPAAAPVSESTPIPTPPAAAPETNTAEMSPATAVATDTTNKGNDLARNDKLGVKNYVKVDTLRLDMLIDSIGEMVIYSSMLIRSCREHLGDNEHIIKTSHQVEKFSRDLQDIGMSMRLDPIKGLFQKMSRLVWDMSKKLKKEINFTMKGEDTELDRTVIEKLADPLMHMVRNALDHGIEPPDERVAAGKPRAGTIELAAAHASGSIHITIKDDGRGLNAEKLRAKAIEKGIITPETKLTESETFGLIFAAGFSTAAVVTDISGRGVGMDVVRNNIESMRGQVKIHSVLGKGTTFHIELPLTLAIIEGIETVVGVERFIIPTLSILEFMRPTPDMITTTSGKAETFSFRGSFLPLFRLSELYGIHSDVNDPTQGIVIVVENGSEQVAVLVDNVVTSCQTVIKNLGEMFEDGKGLAGCAIMPNGDIGLILDVRSLVQLARADYVTPTTKQLPERNVETVATSPILH